MSPRAWGRRCAHGGPFDILWDDNLLLSIPQATDGCFLAAWWGLLGCRLRRNGLLDWPFSSVEHCDEGNDIDWRNVSGGSAENVSQLTFCQHELQTEEHKRVRQQDVREHRGQGASARQQARAQCVLHHHSDPRVEPSASTATLVQIPAHRACDKKVDEGRGPKTGRNNPLDDGQNKIKAGEGRFTHEEAVQIREELGFEDLVGENDPDCYQGISTLWVVIWKQGAPKPAATTVT